MAEFIKAFGQGAGEGVGKAAEGAGKGLKSAGDGLDTVFRGKKSNIKIKSRKGNAMLITKNADRKDIDIDAENHGLVIETDSGVSRDQIGAAIDANKTLAIEHK